eukprot:TRINITY_DN659_c0_g1_i1.p1 TRINITY_DN659_c0_g1~~TRINITY_DN659_c0_g1_i1.p1  ORF type:complete len:488 (+),score=85.78 TRINITY_DN659_c0_g1_i1:76-1539(+)
MSQLTGSTTSKFNSTKSEQLVGDLRKVFRSGRTRSLEWRKSQLLGLRQMFIDNEDEICRALKEDLGKPRFESLVYDLSISMKLEKMVKDLKQFAKPKMVPVNLLVQPGSAEIVPEPLGVCLIIAPWNFPIVLALEPLAGAISAGNCAVLKPSEVSAACSSVLAKLLPKYVDSEAIRVVEGGAPVATALLEQKFDHIFFTGGVKIGKVIMAAAAKHLTPVTLELGGKNPAYVDSTVNLTVAAQRIVAGRFVNAGQICVAPDYVLAEEVIASKLTTEIINVTQEFFGKDPLQSADLARIINDHHWERLDSVLKEEGVKSAIVYGGERDRSSKYIAPTIVRDAPWQSALMQEEVFGPILAIQSVKGVDEAIDIITSRPKPLCLYPFSKNKVVIDRFISETSSGAVAVNDTVMQLSVEGLPFGGVGESGMGAYKGKANFDTFCHFKPVLRRGLMKDPPLRFPPFTDFKQKIVMALMNGNFGELLLILLRLR